MTQFSYFWEGNSIGDTRPLGYSDEDFAERYSSLNLNPLQADNNSLGFIVGTSASSKEPLEIEEDSPASLNVVVNVGAFYYFGRYYENTTIKTLPIVQNLSGNDRIDVLTLTCDWVAQTIRLEIVQGTPSGSPVAPTLTESKGILWQHKLAEITVQNGAPSITNSDIDESFRLPLRQISYTHMTTANTNAPSTFTANWSDTEIQVSDINTMQYTDDSLLFLSADNGVNWYGIVDANNKQEQLNQSGTIGSTDTILASVNLQITGIRPVIIITSFYGQLSSSLNPNIKIKEDSNTIFTITDTSYLLNSSIYPLTYLYKPSVSGNKTFSLTAALPPDASAAFSGAYIVAMEI